MLYSSILNNCQCLHSNSLELQLFCENLHTITLAWNRRIAQNRSFLALIPKNSTQAQFFYTSYTLLTNPRLHYHDIDHGNHGDHGDDACHHRSQQNIVK